MQREPDHGAVDPGVRQDHVAAAAEHQGGPLRQHLQQRRLVVDGDQAARRTAQAQRRQGGESGVAAVDHAANTRQAR